MADKKKGGLITSSLIPIVAGSISGIILNDAWEGAFSQGTPLPGYGQKLFDLSPTVGVGMDDAAQIGLSALVAVAGQQLGSNLVKNIGIGMIAGWGLVKAGEFMPAVESTDAQGTYFRNPISIFPHRYPPSPVAASTSRARALYSGDSQGFIAPSQAFNARALYSGTGSDGNLVPSAAFSAAPVLPRTSAYQVNY